MYWTLALLAGFAFAYGLLSRRVERGSLGGPLVFTAFGLAAGPLGLHLLDLSIEAEVLRTLVELTLALVLFTDAAKADLAVLARSRQIPLRLLLLGLPLSILLGYAVGLPLFGDLAWVEVAVLATVLAPTDAALGKAVVADPGVPPRVREAINVESGLNDGLCVPIFYVFLTLATHETGPDRFATVAITLMLEEIGIGALVGLGLAAAAARLLQAGRLHRTVAETWAPVLLAALAVALFATAQALGGSGFIACFAGGLLFGRLVPRHRHALLLEAEASGGVLSLITWVAFGAAVIGPALAGFTWDVLLYALLSLTAIRILPVLLVLSGSGLALRERLFIAWFGPRGLASIVFAAIVLIEALPSGKTLVMTVVTTVLLSVVAHGLTARPLIAWLGRRADAAGPGRKSAG